MNLTAPSPLWPGSYGAYGGLGAVYQAPGSLDRTLLPGSGVSERNQSSMVDDLRHTIGQLRVSASPLPSPGLGGGDGGGNGTGRGLVSQEKQQGPAEDEAAKAPLAFEASDLEDLAYLGEGAGGAVTKVRSKKTGVIMAKKVEVFTSLVLFSASLTPVIPRPPAPSPRALSLSLASSFRPHRTRRFTGRSSASFSSSPTAPPPTSSTTMVRSSRTAIR